MLVLTRKPNESIQLGDDITITVISVDADRVRIGIDAPRSLKIFRRELLAETSSINREAVAAAPDDPKGGISRLKDALNTKNSEKP